ncbi:MAG: peptidoglycan-binding protein, partial [Clostridiaceae bacterium]|nr:peptidoglycan-binding protein [Clostridiaceae bacterium]
SLTKLGYKPGPIDGIFGSLTEKAVRSFQIAKGLVVDGIVGNNTWSAIDKLLQNTPTPTHFILRRGNTGYAVEYLQQSLTKLGYKPGPIDGIFGSLTEIAVRLFQIAKGLIVDGTVGNYTWAAIDMEFKLPLNVTALGNNIVSYSIKFIGVPYVYGGTTPSGFDCSGFVQYVYAHNGSYQIQLPRTTYDQINIGTPISLSNPQPGDLVFFGIKSSPHHVGIYIGLNKFIEAPHTGANVRVSTLNARKDFCAVIRIIK